jgi:hypothetical protein
MNDFEYMTNGPEVTDAKLEIRCAMSERTGITTVEEYFRNNRRDRKGAPAYIVRDGVTGNVTREYWYRDGRQHREDGPAVIARDAQTGSIIEEHWYIDGRKATPRAPERPPFDAQSRFQVMSLRAT